MYIMVLGTTLVVMAIGLGALQLARQSRRDAAMGQDFLEARMYARSAIEVGLNLMYNTSNWRTTFAQGAWRTAQSLGRGTYSISAVDTVDGNFANNQDDMLLMTGTGAIGAVQYKLAVNVSPYGPKGLSCLASAIHAGTGFTNSSSLTGTAPVSSNGNINNALASTINANAEAGGFITNLGTINGTTTPGATAKEMPLSSVFDSYVAQGGAIVVSALPLNGSVRELKRAVFTPTYNVLSGGPSASGIYVLNCAGAVIRITEVRLHGTLVILDPGAGSSVTGPIHFENYNAANPVLLVRGNIDFSWTGTLSETATGPTNYNPNNAAYGGSTDTDTTDTYPGVMRGLVYVSGSLNVTAGETFEGVVVAGGAVTTSAAVTITHNSAIITAPPPGFEKANRPMLPVAGTWTQIVN